MENKRESLGSRLGFILLSAGCAIGLGNVWSFPYRVGNSGGGAFVLVYIICIILLGIPVMTAEFAIGRASRKSPISMQRVLEKPGQKWHLQGYLCFAGNLFLMMFYTTLAGYFFHYFFTFLFGDFTTLTFGSTIADIPVNVGYMILVVVLGFFVLSFDLQKGLEKVTKFIMLALFALMIILAVYSCTMSGAKEGLTFYLKPDFSQINIKMIISAMCQGFFSLSLGMGAMAIFGSYSDKDHSLLGGSAWVVALDTLVALLAGLIIFPACFTYDISPDAGPSLLFTTMVTVFSNMSLGRFWGLLFFLFMIFAAMSTVLAVFETLLACIRDLTGWSRKKGCAVLCIVMILLCMPMALEGSVLSWFDPFGDGSNGTGFLTLWDYIVETLIQPIGSVLFLIFCCSDKFGWGWDNFITEANTGAGPRVLPWMKVIFKYVTPIIVFILWIYGIVNA